MRIKITKGGLYGSAGEIAVGTELTVKEEPKGWKGRYEVISGSTEGKEPVVNPAPIVGTEGQGGGATEPKAPLAARNKGGGWWGIFDADDKEVGKSMREADGVAFNSLSDEDKLEFVKAGA